jgi:energy-coupling factor transporter ATP-binding protein EcfA2
MPSAFAVSDLRFTFEGMSDPALNAVSLELGTGRSLSVMGRSDAGKTTLLYALSAIIPERKKGKIAGERFLFGSPIGGLRPYDLAGKVAMVFEDFEASLFSTTVRDEVATGPEYLGVPPAETAARVSGCLKTCGLGGFENRRVEDLSGGEKQRLAVAAALAMGAELILFDEATTDLDPRGKAEIARLSGELTRKGRTVVSVDTEPEAALSADELSLMSGGHVVSRGVPRDLLIDAEVCAEAGIPPLSFLKFCEKRGGEWYIRSPVSVDERAFRGLTVVKKRGNGELALEVENLFYSYPGGTEALSGVNLRVYAGEMVAVLGQNGSGKTTLAKCIANILSPARGGLRLYGKETTEILQRERARIVGYLFQNPDNQIFSETVFDEVAFGLRNTGISGNELESRVTSALKTVGLTGREGDDPFALTKGGRQRVALASVLAMEPRIVILDEPTTGLDFEETRSVMELLVGLNKSGMTVIVITHSMGLVADYIPRTVILNGGVVALDGPTRDVFGSVGELEDFGIEPPIVTKVTAQKGFPCLNNYEFGKVFGGGRV